MLAATPSSASRRFVNQIYGGRDPVATIGEIVSVVANTQMHTYKVAGPHVLLEQEVLSRIAGRIGYAEGEGIFTPGSSLANMMAMVLARNEALPGAGEDGLEGLGRAFVYTSAGGHYSIGKAMATTGLGSRNLRHVPVDREGRMDVDRLRRRIRSDLAEGGRPVMINATAGTTVLGAFDPLPEIAEIAAEHGAWLHIDGTFGGPVLFSEASRHLARGSELSDSFTWSGHKMMGVPLLCSTLMVRKPGLLARHFHQAADYLFQADSDDLNPGTRSMQCGRRNDALKLWCAWQYYGDEGYAARVERQFELTRHAVKTVENDPELILCRRPQSINICFEVAGKSSAAICDRLHRDGRFLVGHGTVDGKQVIRLVCVNPDLTETDLDEFFAAIRSAAAETRQESDSPRPVVTPESR